jgi:nuclear pore complex protein Nup93
MSSIFAGLGSVGQPSSGAPPTSGTAPKSLFGGLGTSTSQTPTSGGFGALGGLGGIGAKTSAPATASLFSTQATSQPQGGGLFQSTTSQAPQQSNPLGNTQQTGAGGLFGGIGSQQPQQQQQQQQQQQAPSAPLAQSGAAGTSALFDHLLERGRKRNAGENGLNSFDELPTLQLGLGDIARKVRNLGAGGPSADQNQDRAA